MAQLITKQFPHDPAPTADAYARHEGSVDWHRKTNSEGHLFFTVYKSAAARQAAGIGGVEHLIPVPATHADPAVQALIDVRAALIQQLIAAEYELAIALDPAFAAGEAC